MHVDPCPSKFRNKRVEPCRLGDVQDFEDLYYVVWYKILMVYQELQVRYQGRFISLADTLHEHGISPNGKRIPINVADFIGLLRTWWSILTDPAFMATLDFHLRSRFPTLDGGAQQYSRQYEPRGNVSSGLQGLSSLSPRTLINQLYKKHGFILETERKFEAEHQMIRDTTRIEIKYLLRSKTLRETGSAQEHPLVKQWKYYCVCGENCECESFCADSLDDSCPCAMPTPFYINYAADKESDLQLEQRNGCTTGEHFLFGAATSEAAQLIVAQAALSKDLHHGASVDRTFRNVELQSRKIEYEYLCRAKEEVKMLPSTRSLQRAVRLGLADSVLNIDTGRTRSASTAALKSSEHGSTKPFRATRTE